MKIFTFEFYDTFERESHWFDVLAHSEDEAERLLRQELPFHFNRLNFEFRGCRDITELDKPKILI